MKVSSNFSYFLDYISQDFRDYINARPFLLPEDSPPYILQVNSGNLAITGTTKFYEQDYIIIVLFSTLSLDGVEIYNITPTIFPIEGIQTNATIKNIEIYSIENSIKNEIFRFLNSIVIVEGINYRNSNQPLMSILFSTEVEISGITSNNITDIDKLIFMRS